MAIILYNTMDELLKLAQKLEELSSPDKYERLRTVTKDIAYNIRNQLMNANNGSSIKFTVKYGYYPSLDQTERPTIIMTFSVFNPDKSDYSKEQEQYKMVVVLSKKMHGMHAIEDFKNLVIKINNIDIPRADSVTIAN